MDPNQYQRLCQRTECNQVAARTRYNGNLLAVRLNYAVIGLAGEVGELASAVEKWLHYGQDLDRVNIKEELGDCLWYIALACNALGLDLNIVMASNIAKLKARYPEKYEDFRAVETNRNRGEERTVLEDQGDESNACH